MHRVLKLVESENSNTTYLVQQRNSIDGTSLWVVVLHDNTTSKESIIGTFNNREDAEDYRHKLEERKGKLSEAIEDEEIISQEDLENQEDMEDVVDSEEEQEENPVEEESELDKQLDELREILVDLDLNLYRIASKENPNDVIYVIGKVADESNDVLMLIDTKPEEVNSEEDIGDEIVIDKEDMEESISGTDAQIEDAKKDSKEKGLYSEDEEEIETPEERFDFVVLPKKFDDINKLNPRYGEELTPDHQAIIDYLMNCLIEVNPEAAEELENNSEEDLPIPDDINVDIDIDREEDLV